MKAMRLPSGDHAKSEMLSPNFVRRLASPPFAGISHTCVSASSPPRSDRNAIDLPSGDHCGRDSSNFGVLVRRTRWLPSKSTRHRSDWLLSSAMLAEVAV
jgi:hypothetical protein